jgi:hypothetical protein
MVIDDEGGENGTKMYMKNMIKGRRIMKDWIIEGDQIFKQHEAHK